MNRNIPNESVFGHGWDHGSNIVAKISQPRFCKGSDKHIPWKHWFQRLKIGPESSKI